MVCWKSKRHATERVRSSPSSCRLHTDFGLVDASEDTQGFIQKYLASPGQARAACRAFEQLHAKVLLQLLDRPRQRRLLDVQALGGAGEMQFLSDRDKAAKMA